jgi:hypothetical protein
MCESVTFCSRLNLPVLGVIENMSRFVCPQCGGVVDIFKSGGGEAMACEMRVPFLGRIPLEATVVAAADDGTPHVHRYQKTAAGRAFSEIVNLIDCRIKSVRKGKENVQSCE